MATHVGTEGVVKLGSNSIAEIKSFSLTITQDMAEDTQLSDTAKTFLPVRYSWTAEAECHWDETDTNGQVAIQTAATGQSSVTLNLYPEGSTTGDVYYSGTAYVTSTGIAVTDGDTIKRTISFQGSGALATSTAP